MQYSSSSETFNSTYAESSRTVKSLLSSTSTFLSTGIHDDVPTGITPKKKNWNVPSDWERTEPREALLEAFRRKRHMDPESPPDAAEVNADAEEEAVVIPAVRSTDSLVSASSTPSGPLTKTTTTTTGKVIGGGDLALGKMDKRVVVPLGENGGNIPVPRRTRK